MKHILTCLLVLASLCPSLCPAQRARHNQELLEQMSILNEALGELDLYYVDTLQTKKLVTDALDYLLAGLDPYTTYYAPGHTDELQQMTTGRYGGIGSVISYRADLDRCILSEPYEHMPAAEAGLRQGDVLLAINGQDLPVKGSAPVADYTSSVSQQLRGEAGSTLTLRVQRVGEPRPLTFRVTRAQVNLPDVKLSQMLPDSTGYIWLTGFTEGAARSFRLALVELKKQGLRRLVIDLRGNPGGVIDEAVNLVSLFVPRGSEAVSLRGKVRESCATYKTKTEPLDLQLPLCVLVDGGTASAAEIVAGVLQDYDRALVVGARTYGKGLVQQPRELPYGAMLKLTSAKYYIPSGRCVQAYRFKDGEPVHLPDSLARTFTTRGGRPVRDAGGITPDVLVPLDTMPDMLYYLESSDQLFDYAVRYRAEHSSIAPPETFSLTDEELVDFKNYLREKGFTYDRRSQSLLAMLRQVAEREGYAESAAAEFDALSAKLTPSLETDFAHWSEQMRQWAEQTIVGCYYYRRGTQQYFLRHDPTLRRAQTLLRDGTYQRILSGQE